MPWFWSNVHNSKEEVDRDYDQLERSIRRQQHASLVLANQMEELTADLTVTIRKMQEILKEKSDGEP